MTEAFENKAAVLGVGGIGNILFYVSAFISTYKCIPKIVPFGAAGANACARFVRPEHIVAANKAYLRPECFNNMYYQHSRWLVDKDIILKNVLVDIPESSMAKKYDLVIHYRGCDFKTSPLHRKCTLDVDTVEHAMDKLKASSKYYRNRDIKVLVVTDDYEAAKEAYPGMDIVSSDNPVTDFATMLQAKNLLIYPGSTFSYWAGYLGYQEHVYLPVFNWPCDNFDMYDLTSAGNSEDLVFPGATVLYGTCE